MTCFLPCRIKKVWQPSKSKHAKINNHLLLLLNDLSYSIFKLFVSVYGIDHNKSSLEAYIRKFLGETETERRCHEMAIPAFSWSSLLLVKIIIISKYHSVLSDLEESYVDGTFFCNIEFFNCKSLLCFEPACQD